MKGYVSLSVRLLINVESLNGVESVGNLSRHRTVPIVIAERDQQGNVTGYSVRFVPAVSGESLAHGYQSELVDIAKKMNLPLGIYSSRKEFLKFADDDIMKREGFTNVPSKEDEIRKYEAKIMLKDIVADIGGFLYAGKYAVKRSSCFSFSYMIPAVDEIEGSAMEAQFHVRFSPSELAKQAPYNVEVGSAVYTFTFGLNISRIGVLSTEYGDKDTELEKKLSDTRSDRVKAALIALENFLTNLSFGAKKLRFDPNIKRLSAVAAVSRDSVFVVSSGNSRNYIKETIDRVNAYKDAMKSLTGKDVEIKLIVFDDENALNGVDIPDYVVKVNTLEELAKKISEYFITS